jgi:hypothetical protein
MKLMTESTLIEPQYDIVHNIIILFINLLNGQLFRQAKEETLCRVDIPLDYPRIPGQVREPIQRASKGMGIIFYIF